MSPGTDFTGSYFASVGKVALLSPEEEKRLFRQISRGNKEARNRMIDANLRLVISIARRYMHMGLLLPDLIEEGNIGLMKAVERYSLKKKCRFSTYASWWIRQSITRALSNQSRLIRIPVYLLSTIKKIQTTLQELREKYKREPGIEEIARRMKLSAEKVMTLMNVSTPPSSLEAPFGEEGAIQLLDTIKDDGRISELSSMIEHERIMYLVGKLSEKEATVMKLRFGLEDGLFRTLAEVGLRLKLTRERIRQIEKVAIKKLRHQLPEVANEGLNSQHS